MSASKALAVLTATMVIACSGGNSTKKPAEDGRVEVGVDVSALSASIHMCMTWKLFELVAPPFDPTHVEPPSWQQVDASTEPQCSADGVAKNFDFGTCHGGRRFLVQYEITFYNSSGYSMGTVNAVSGGAASDVCWASADRQSIARVQFATEGSAGGVDPTVIVDNVCFNNKMDFQTVSGSTQTITAFWLAGEDCASGVPPDSYCVLTTGSGVATERYGITDDGVRYIFNLGQPDSPGYDIYYLMFEPEVPAETLILTTSPWVLATGGRGGEYPSMYWSRNYPENKVVSYRFDDSAGAHVGVVTYTAPNMAVLHDDAASCNGPVQLGAQTDTVAIPNCAGGLPPEALGAVQTGTSTFDIAFMCPEGLFFVSCDATHTAEPICSL